VCGIAGFFDITLGTTAEALETNIKRMTDSIVHRGPDDSGAWFDPSNGIALGIRRLAVLDLSPTGSQPMHSSDGRFVIVFNGEIYNFSSLRKELRNLGHSFRGTSDTEIMLASVSQWGLKSAVQHFNGMFAFALWDREERTLSLVRDRLGIKPLYFGWAGHILLFGSELKALRSHPAFQADINRDALTLYLRHAYIPAPHSIYAGFFKLDPGCILTFQPGQHPGGEKAIPYWSARQVVENGLAHPFEGDPQEAIDMLEAQLTHSIGLRMIADVPLGAFLSGGLDSSTIVALMQKLSNQPIKTFTIGFAEAGYNEAEYAKAVARHLGTAHTELYVTSDDARAVIPRLPELFDEPFADPSQIPTFLIAQLARQHVTVSLTGDGGDELFGGYIRYLWVKRIWDAVGWVPASIRGTLANGLMLIPPQTWGRLLNGTGYPNVADKVQRLSEVLNAPSPEAIYLDLVSHWKNPSELVLASHEPLTALTDPKFRLKTGSLAERMMALDMLTYLPDDVLVKVDRPSMGVSLEARAPFLDDHETVEFAWRLPLNMKIRQGQGKWILRQVLYRHIPQNLLHRPKMGFGVPIDKWLRGPLRAWAEDLLTEDRLRRDGYFTPAPIRQKWAEHLSGQRNWQFYLWDILMFQAWEEATFK
jgi:asparagine synthase (glutamine-hydrolysing)